MRKDERQPMIAAIRECSSKQLLDIIFQRFEMDKLKDRVGILLEAMYNPEVFFSQGKLSMEEKYNTLVAAFLSGIWKKDK
jgi:hypothetical protein